MVNFLSLLMVLLLTVLLPDTVYTKGKNPPSATLELTKTASLKVSNSFWHQLIYSPQNNRPFIMIPLPTPRHISNNPLLLSPKKAITPNLLRSNQTNKPQSDDDTPKLVAHTITNVKIKKGNIISLNANSIHSDLKYIWLKNNKVLCRKSTCRIFTNNWPIGINKVVLLAYNDQGSIRVEYTIDVRFGDRLKDFKKKVFLPIKNQIDSQTYLSNKDYYIKLHQGLGYLHKKNTTKLLDPIAQRLSWHEKINTDSTGSVVFGLPYNDEHFIMGRSHINLALSNSSERLILLKTGIIRCRNLGGGKNLPSLLVDDWLQVDLGNHGDAVVRRSSKAKKEYVEITAIRGFIRVFYQPRYHSKKMPPRPPQADLMVKKKLIQDKGSYYIIILPPGSGIKLTKRYFKPPIITLPFGKTVNIALQGSTPAYLNQKLWSEKQKDKLAVVAKKLGAIFSGIRYLFQGGFHRLIKDELRPKTLNGAIRIAKKALYERDFLYCLEALLPFAGKSKNPELFLMIAKAYQGISNRRLAYRYYKKAEKKHPSHDEIAFGVGLLAMGAENWEVALDYFSQIDSPKKTRLQEIRYYRGVAKFNLGNHFLARNAFSRALYIEANENITRSSKEYLEYFDDQENFLLALTLGFSADSNVFRIPADIDPPADIIHRSSNVLLLDFNLKQKLLDIPTSNVFVGLWGQNHSYLLPSMNVLDLKLFFDTKVNYLDTKERKIIIFGCYPFLNIKRINSEGIDGFGLKTQIGFPEVSLGPKVFFESAQYLDIKYVAEPLVDPFTHETTTASKIAAKIKTYGIDLDLLKSKLMSLGGDLRLIHNAHPDEESKNSDYEDQVFKLYSSYFYDRYLTVKGSMLFTSRTYPNSPDDRKDVLKQLSANLKWHHSLALDAAFFVDIIQNDSSVSDRSYKKNVVGILGNMRF